MLNKIYSFILLTRPLNVLIAFLSLWIAAIISPQFTMSGNVFRASLTVAFIAAGGNIINDIFDLEIDKINKPRRTLVLGLVSLPQARMLFYFSYGVGLFFSLLSGLLFFIIAALIALLLYFYSAILKGTALAGNLVVSFASSMVFIYGALAVNNFSSGIIPAAFVFLFHLGREIIKDMQDLEGDLSQNAVTFPGKFGRQFSVVLINIIFIILTLLTLLPYILSIYNRIYLFIVVAGVDSVLLFSSVVLWFRREPEVLGRLSHLLKLDMFVGLAAILMGSRNVVFFN